MKRLPRISAVAILFLTAPVVAGLVAMPLLWCIRVWHWPDWFVALLGCLVSAGLMYSIWRLVLEAIRNRFRFTLRTMIVAIAVFGLLMGTFGTWWIRVAAQYRSFHNLMAYGAVFKSARDGDGYRRPTLIRWFGYDPFETEQDLFLTNDRAFQEALSRSDELRDIAQLSFGRGVTAASLMQVNRLNNPAIKSVAFVESPIDSAGLKRIAEWKNLRHVFFNGCPQVRDADLAELAALPQLETLALFEEGGGMKIGDAGLENIEKMQSLKSLAVANMSNTTDAGFAHLHALKNLEDLSIHGCGLTESGLRELHDALPNCRIETDVPSDGTRNVRQIMVRRLRAPSASPATIDDPATIASILKLIEAITQQQTTWLQPRFEDQPRSADFELTFKGQARTLWQVRFDRQTLQEENVQKEWNRWQISPEQAAELKSLAGLDE